MIAFTQARASALPAILVGIFAVFFGTATAALAQATGGYDAGHGALQIWNAEGQALAPKWVQIWLPIMGLTFAAGLFFIWRHVEARWVVGGFIASLLTMIFVIPALGLVPLSGLIALLHVIFWSPGLYLMVKRRPFAKGLSAYAIWSAAMTAVILFSFVFDIRDAAIYLDHMLGTGLIS